MGRLNFTDTIQETIIKFANGNPGAITMLLELQKNTNDNMAFFLLTIDRMELYEDKLYMLWNDCCDRNIKKVIKILEFYEKEIITQNDIDERIKNVGYGQSFDDLLEGSN